MSAWHHHPVPLRPTSVLPCLPLQTLASINSMENPKAQQLGCIILAASQSLDLLWEKCTPTMVLGWLSKMSGQISVMDKIEVRPGTP